MRYFICDDSGSMMSNDGHRLVESNPTPRFVSYSNTLNARFAKILCIATPAVFDSLVPQTGIMLPLV